MKHLPRTLLSTALSAAVGVTLAGISTGSWAGAVTGWNTDNADLAGGQKVQGTRYANPVYLDATKTELRGELEWVESDVKAPGIQAITGANAVGSSCILAAGVNPKDNTAKECNDPAGTNKHFKLGATVVDGKGIDLVFNVSQSAVNTTYQIYQSIVNNSPASIGKFKVRLGFGLGAGFGQTGVTSLTLSKVDGTPYSNTLVDADPLSPESLSGNFPTHLYGPGTGFFDNTQFASMGLMKAKDSELQFDLPPVSYTGTFGDWLDTTRTPFGYFFNHDNNPNTQAQVVGFWDGTSWLNDTSAVIDTATLVGWANDARYEIGFIKGLAEFQFRYNVNVGDITNWPTYDATAKTATFTVSILPVSALAANTNWRSPTPPPIAVDEGYSLIDSSKAFSINNANEGVLKNDVSPSGANLTASIVDQATLGVATLNSDGTFTYTAGVNYKGNDAFTYTVSDGVAQSNVATARVSGGVPVPIAVDDSYTLPSERNALVISNPAELLTANDTTYTEVMIAKVNNQPKAGTVSINADGSFTYTAKPAIYANSDSFTYVINDGFNNSAPATVTITGGGTVDGPSGTGCAGAMGTAETASIDPLLPFLAIGSIGALASRRRKADHSKEDEQK